MDREAWRATVQGVAKSQIQLSDHFTLSRGRNCSHKGREQRKQVLASACREV